MLLLESNNTLVKMIFTEKDNGTNGQKAGSKGGKLAFISVGGKFRTQLTQLMEKLHSTVSGEMWVWEHFTEIKSS